MTRVIGTFGPRINLIQRSVPSQAISLSEFGFGGNKESFDWGRVVELYENYDGLDPERDLFPETAAETMEFAGRNCYNAFGRKNDATAATADYLKNIIQQNHLSVLEHSSFSFLLEDVSRAATHEIVRHRHFSFSQESQRFVGLPDIVKVVIPPALADGLSEEEMDFIERGAIPHVYTLPMEKAVGYYEEIYKRLKAKGYKHKQAAEAARSVLPNYMATKIVVTGNARSWMEFIQKRDSEGADRELQEIAQQIAVILSDELPEVFHPEVRELWPNNSEQKGVKK